MARHETDREDIMREAVALKRRVSLTASDSTEPIVCGVRSNGYWSFYLDHDRVYQFDDQLRLRRAFVLGHLYRTQGTTLARLHRERTDQETQLVRVDLDVNEMTAFLQEARSALAQLLSQIGSGAARVAESIPSETNLIHDLCSVLGRLVGKAIELAPAIAGKR